jgi:hypothetical protein
MLLPLLLPLVFLLSPVPHAVHLQCRLEEKKLVIEAFYDDDMPAQDALVEIVDAQNKVLVSGRTNDKGVFRTEKPTPGKYLVRLDAGAGHKAKVNVTIPATGPLTTAPAGKGQIVSEGPTREEVTRFPWEQIGLGLLVIVGVCAGLWLMTSRRQKITAENSEKGSDHG